MRHECAEIETEVSYVRRLAQARIDILQAEVERRAAGGSLGDLIDALPRILSDSGDRAPASATRLTNPLAPSMGNEWNRGLERLISDATLVNLPSLTDEEVASTIEQLHELEREVSTNAEVGARGAGCPGARSCPTACGGTDLVVPPNPADAVEARLRDLGEFIREQRRSDRLSLRKLSELAGISNPYLSQIERGLRKPSAEILQAIARGLRISAETLYVRAGILDEPDDEPDLVAHILRDPTITERQKQALVDIYRSFQAERSSERPATANGAAAE